jgi:DNA invertase Pin-like site-specific DNA recombinase
MNAALYGRKSQENEENVQIQVDNARAFATSKGWSVSDTNIFTDDGISGAEFVDRPGFTAMRAAAKAKRFNVLVTMNVDRLGREAYRTSLALLEIAEAGVRIFTYADGQEVKLDTPIAKQMLSMKNYAAEDFRQQIADKTREKLIAKARAGHATGTRTFGYDLMKVGKHVERRINPDESATIKRIFEMAAEGIGNRRIINTLAKESVPAPGRKGWAKGILKTLLVNDLYGGVVVYGKSKSAASGGAAERRTKATPCVTLAMPALRIVSDELWAKVQTRKTATRAHYIRTPDGKLMGKPEAGLAATHLLNGIARCGVCGGALSYSKKNARTKRYYCLTATTKGIAGCKNGHGVPERELDRAVVNALHELLSDQDTVWALVTERAARWRRAHEIKGGERRNGEKEIVKLEAIVARLTDAIEKSQPVGDRLKERQAELDTLQARLEEPDDIDLDRDYLVCELNKWVGPLVNSNDPVQTRQVMRHLGISRIVVSPDPSGGWRFDGGANLAGLVGGGAKGSDAAPPDTPHRLPDGG